MSASTQQRARQRPTDPLCGTRYKSVSFLGRGGMGEVVLAEHIGLGKLVVVKLLHEKLAKDQLLVKRMQIEARSLAALTSPHIVQVIDFGQTASGRTYYVMERLIGRTLGAEVKARGAIPVAEAVAYTVEVLAGLEAAHAMGIVHRDIKGDNIFLCDATKETPRTVKVLDFGVAKVLDIATAVQRPALPHLETEQGQVLGTPRMLAPEQALGRPVDARTDVYATAHLLYTALAGHGPFAHITDEVELLKANVEQRPDPPSWYAPQPIPPALDLAILRGLEKRPEDRFPSAEAFADALRAIAAEPAAEPPVDRKTVPLLRTPAAASVREDPTVQLPGGTIAVAPPTLPFASAPDPRRPAPDIAARAITAPRRSRTAFVALVLLGAALSAILLFALTRGTP